MNRTDILIVGGGAAAMAAAISAKRANPKEKVLLMEKMPKLGTKLSASGNGKCNITNSSCQDYLKALGFFESVGILTRTDEMGRLYPYNEEAKSVTQALKKAMEREDVSILLNREVIRVELSEEGFIVEYKINNNEKKNNLETVLAKKLLIATGGKSYPKMGTTGDGYRIAKSLGHKIETLIPVLAPIEVRESMDSLKGIREKAMVRLLKNGQEIAAEEGQVQFTQEGLSGICVFDISRFLIKGDEDKTIEEAMEKYSLEVDFFPHVTNVLSILENQGLEGEDMLLTLVKRPVAKEIFKRLKTKEALTKEAIAHELKHLSFAPSKTKGWQFSQVTRGGVSLEEINPQTMESLLVKNLYFAGEVIDYDGPCGGFNLNNSWITGVKAGEALGK